MFSFEYFRRRQKTWCKMRARGSSSLALFICTCSNISFDVFLQYFLNISPKTDLEGDRKHAVKYEHPPFLILCSRHLHIPQKLQHCLIPTKCVSIFLEPWVLCPWILCSKFSLLYRLRSQKCVTHPRFRCLNVHLWIQEGSPWGSFCNYGDAWPPLSCLLKVEITFYLTIIYFLDKL